MYIIADPCESFLNPRDLLKQDTPDEGLKWRVEWRVCKCVVKDSGDLVGEDVECAVHCVSGRIDPIEEVAVESIGCGGDSSVG